MQFDALFKQLIEATSDIVIVTDACPVSDGGPRIVYVNPAFEKCMGFRQEEVLGKTPHLFNGPDTDAQTRYRINRALAAGKPIRTEILKYARDGKTVWLDVNIVPLTNEAGEITHFASIERDLTRFKKMERQLANMALFDSLTGAMSRPAFFAQADKEFQRARRYHRPLSVVMLDIDHFKSINDRYGHSAGDNVLEIFVEAVQEVIRGPDFLGRIGGEEFAILLPDTPLKAAHHLAERVRERIIKYPYLAGEMLIEVSASLGVAELQDDDNGFKVFLHRADEALYQAKQLGRNRVHLAADTNRQQSIFS